VFVCLKNWIPIQEENGELEKKLRTLSYSVEKLKEELVSKETQLVIERRGKLQKHLETISRIP